MRTATSVVATLLILMALVLWLFAAQILNAVIPSLVGGESTRIDDLEVSSIGWRRMRIDRLSGVLRTAAGPVAFELGSTTVNYDLGRRRLGLITVEDAGIEYDPRGKGIDTGPGDTAFAFPPEVAIDRLRLRVAGAAEEFDGRFELSSSSSAFVAQASDRSTFMEVSGDSSFSEFRARLALADRSAIAEATIHLDGPAEVRFDGRVELTPLLTWLRQTRLLPARFLAWLSQIENAGGTVQAAGRGGGGAWMLALATRANLVTTDYYGNLAVDGELELNGGMWKFTSTRTGSITVHIPSYQLDHISTLSFELPPGYSVGTDPAVPQTVSGRGALPASFDQTGDTRLRAKIMAWSMLEGKEIKVEAQDLALLSPQAATAERARASVVLTHTSPLIMEGDIAVSGIRSTPWPDASAEVSAAGLWNWNDGDFRIDGDAQWNEQPMLSWSVNSDRHSGELTVEMNRPAGEVLRHLRSMLGKSASDIELTKGTVQANLYWNWDASRYHGQLEISAADLEGRVTGLRFHGAAVHLSSADLLAPTAQFEGTVSSVILANDVDATDVSFGGRWQNGLYVDRAEMSILDGRMKLKPVHLDPASNSQRIEVELELIDLEPVFAMLGQEGLTASGRITGVIPLVQSAGGIAIDQGHLRNSTRGTISYAPAADTASPQLDNIALQALRDFRYDVLDATLDYHTNGDYVIHARLEGRNPELYNGYPIAFNINLTGTLPGLLRATLITGDFHSEILRQIQKQQQ